MKLHINEDERNLICNGLTRVSNDSESQLRADQANKLLARVSNPAPLYSFVIKGQSKVTVLVSFLLHQSQWFEVTPYPDDSWRIDVKEENKAMIINFIGKVS